MLGLVWLLCLGTTLGCTLAVYTFSELMIEVRRRRGGPPAFISWDPWPPTPSAPAPHRTLFSQDLFSFLFCLMLL